jgi:hypothetical protein
MHWLISPLPAGRKDAAVSKLLLVVRAWTQEMLRFQVAMALCM